MARRWVLSLAGALVLVGAAVGVAALTGSFGGHRTHEVAQQARTTPSPLLLETPTPTPTPKPHRKHHVAASGHAAVQHGSSRSSQGRSGVLPADPCAHNHHCYVPPLPPLKPDTHRPPIGPPVATVSGAVVPPPAAN